MRTFKVLGIRVDSLSFYDTIVEAERLINRRKPAYIISLSALTVLLARADAEFARIIRDAAIVSCDGTGVKLAVRLLHGKDIKRVSGVDLIPHICGFCAERGFGVYFLGSRKESVAGAVKRMKTRFPDLKVSGFCDGYFDEKNVKYVVSGIKKAAPQVLFIGLGQPVQEKWINSHMSELGVPLLIGVGGSFDVLSGRLKRAPYLFQKAGLEWAYRLFLEPWRMRRILRLFRFVGLILKEKYSIRRKNI